MKSKKRLKIARIILTILVLTAGTFLYFNHGPKINIEYQSEFLLGEPVKIEIETYDDFKIHTPESLEISISNRYNKNESLTSEIKPYQEGKYELLIHPNFAGEYQVHVKYKDGTVNKTFNSSFKIE